MGARCGGGVARALGDRWTGKHPQQGRTAMSERGCDGKEACAVCGSMEWAEGVFTMGRLVCRPCWREIERHRAKARPRQESLALAQPAQREGVQR